MQPTTGFQVCCVHWIALCLPIQSPPFPPGSSIASAAALMNTAARCSGVYLVASPLSQFSAWVLRMHSLGDLAVRIGCEGSNYEAFLQRLV